MFSPLAFGNPERRKSMVKTMEMNGKHYLIEEEKYDKILSTFSVYQLENNSIVKLIGKIVTDDCDCAIKYLI